MTDVCTWHQKTDEIVKLRFDTLTGYTPPTAPVAQLDSAIPS